MFIENPSELVLPISVYLVAILVLLCYHSFRNRHTRLGALRYVALGLVIWSYCLSTPGLANAIISQLESLYPPITAPAPSEDSLIVILSSGYVDGSTREARLDAAGWERTYAGVRLWKQVGGRILFVGGPAQEGVSSPAEAMQKIAMEWGVPPSATMLETRSRNTHQNILFSRSLIAEHRGTVWLVTSALHMHRAMGVSRQLHLRVQPYPCDYRKTILKHWYAWVPNSGGPAMFADVLHEVVGLEYYRLLGYAD